MRTLLVLLLVGCAPHGDSGVAWPKPRVAERDGGESLAPHTAAAVAAAAASDDDDEVVPGIAAPVVLDAPKVDAPRVDAPKPIVDETITTEEMVIEVEDN